MLVATFTLALNAALPSDERTLAVRNQSSVAVRGLVAEIAGTEKRIPPVAPRGSVVVKVRTDSTKPWEIFRARDGLRERLGECGRIDSDRPDWSTVPLVSPDAGPSGDCVLVILPH
jgi:hypothetical protein